MREVLRIDTAASRPGDVHEVRADRDTCVRATFAATAVVRGSFADAAGLVRGEVTTASAGVIPARGPACMKKGEALRLVVADARGATVRAVIFAAP